MEGVGSLRYRTLSFCHLWLGRRNVEQKPTERRVRAPSLSKDGFTFSVFWVPRVGSFQLSLRRFPGYPVVGAPGEEHGAAVLTASGEGLTAPSPLQGRGYHAGHARRRGGGPGRGACRAIIAFSRTEVTEDGLRCSEQVNVLAAVLDRIVMTNKAIEPGPCTKFQAMRPPSISILDYLLRVHKYAKCSTECFVLALIYIDRLIQRNAFILSGLNVHRVIIISIMVAAKFFDDHYYNNAYYAKVGGVPCDELNRLEVDFLFRVDFTLHVKPEVRFNRILRASPCLTVARPMLLSRPRISRGIEMSLCLMPRHRMRQQLRHRHSSTLPIPTPRGRGPMPCTAQRHYSSFTRVQGMLRCPLATSLLTGDEADAVLSA